MAASPVWSPTRRQGHTIQDMQVLTSIDANTVGKLDPAVSGATRVSPLAIVASPAAH